jgi:hypothetical protein
MLAGTSRRAVVILVGTLALTRCSGGNEVAGPGGGNRNIDPPTATPVPAPPTPRVVPTPRPCPPRFGDECGGPE